MTPIDEIKDPYEFQRIVAEYFRTLVKSDLHNIQTSHVDDSGVGTDGGCDIMVEFVMNDSIVPYSRRWIVECKYKKAAVNDKDINMNTIGALLKSKNACGYLLVCRNDATSKLKNIFKELSAKQGSHYFIWNGSQLWRMFNENISILKSFFPDYYNKTYISNNSQQEFRQYVKTFSKKMKGGKEK